MPRLVALDLPGGVTFLEAMVRVHDAGDAVWPIDQRLPAPAKRFLVDLLRPALIVTATGNEKPERHGIPTQDGDAFVVATSGTTGEPRGVVLTRDAVAASATASNARLGVDATSDGWLCCLPVAHVGGLSVITRALAAKTHLEIQPGFDTDLVVQATRRGATLVSLVPTTCRRLGNEVRRFRTVLLGGGAIPKDKPANAVSTYGMTETGSGVVYDGWPLENVSIRIEDGNEIALRAPMLFRAYRDGTDPKQDGWFRTGDAGRLRDDGSVEVFGRIAEVIRSGGEMVWPTRVEESLRRHPRVRDAAVIGIADPEWQERVVAVIEQEGEAPNLDELRAHVTEELGHVFAPRELLVVDSLPKSAIGKVRREALRELVSRDENR